MGKKVIDFALGTHTNAFEIPYKLQGFYAYKYVFYELTRTDFLKQYDEVVNGDKLIKMNKAIDLGLKTFFFNNLEIDPETADKLGEYVRTIFLAGLAASIIKGYGEKGVREGKKIENRIRISRDKTLTRDSVLTQLRDAAVRDGFFKTRMTRKGEEIDASVEQLFNFVVDNRDRRTAPTPFELKDANLDLNFTDEELKKDQVGQLYPLHQAD
jgi:hypothetical protein